MKQFYIHTHYIVAGWCGVEMHINGKKIVYHASYIGSNPISSLIDACLEFDEMGGDYYIEWFAEPGSLKINMYLENDCLRLDIFDMIEDITSKIETRQEWHEVVPYADFKEAVVTEGFRVLRSFGIMGFRSSWQDNQEFFLGALLSIYGKSDDRYYMGRRNSDLTKEMEIMATYMRNFEPQEEKHYDQCTIYYESWQIQCCGDPFAVGEKIDWQCTIAPGANNAHGYIIDFEEEHHYGATHSISGTVSKIIAERSEFPKGKGEVYYHAANVIHTELQQADGYESQYKSDETTDRIFWGYIVMLDDVVVKPLADYDIDE